MSKKQPVPCGRRSPDGDRPNMSVRRMVLVGKTGAGKGSSGNTILGRMGFRAAKSGSSITKECSKETGLVGDTQVVLVDTPGVFDTTLSEDALNREISKCINMTSPGPHAIILVLQFGPFTREECLSVEKIRAIFGEDADRYTIILFTHGDEVQEPIVEHLEKAPKELKRLIDLCGGRYHVFDNTRMDDRTQVLRFLNKVDDMVESNGGEFYNNSMFNSVDQGLKVKAEELQKMYDDKLKMLEQELTQRFTEEQRKLQEKIEKLEASNQDLQQLVKIQEQELKEYRRFYNRKRTCVRQEAELTEVSEYIAKEICRRLKKMMI